MSVIGNLLRSRARERLVSALLRLACRICGARPARGCDPESLDGEMILLARDPDLLMAHTERAQDAVSAGLVSRAVLLRQFADGETPASLTGNNEEGTRHA